MTNNEIVKKLSALKGIGEWTAEMTLIFSLQRKNVLSYGDYGIKKGLRLLHNIGKIDKKTFNYYKEIPYSITIIMIFRQIEVANLV